MWAQYVRHRRSLLRRVCRSSTFGDGRDLVRLLDAMVRPQLQDGPMDSALAEWRTLTRFVRVAPAVRVNAPPRRRVRAGQPSRRRRSMRRRGHSPIFPCMLRFAAFLRGVSPTNARMPELKAAFEAAGFADVKTVLSSGNVVFTAPAASAVSLQQQCETAMTKGLGHTFPTIVRPIDALRDLLESDPYRAFRLEPGSKRVVTLLRERPKSNPQLPIEVDGARILAVEGMHVFSAYVVSPKGPVFMRLIERTFGKDVTTRTWETIIKVVRQGAEPTNPGRMGERTNRTRAT